LDGATDVARNAVVNVSVTDGDSGVPDGAIRLYVDAGSGEADVTAGAVVTGTAAARTITYDRPTDYPADTLVRLRTSAADAEGNARTNAFSFRTGIEIDTTPPGTPVGVLPAVLSNTIVITWQLGTEPDLAGYIVTYSRDGGAPVEQRVGLVYTTQIENLEDGTYSVSVRAVDASGNESASSAPWSVRVYTSTEPPPRADDFDRSFAICPNLVSRNSPAATLRWLVEEEGDPTLRIFAATGALVREIPLAGRAALHGVDAAEIDLSGLASAVYIVEFAAPWGSTHARLVVAE
jgi:hypothetical protein